MSIRVSAVVERLRASLFFVPMVFVIVGAGAGAAVVEVDKAIVDRQPRIPFVLTTTVESARELLSTVAAATITVAGIAFSVSLLVIQQASSQYSPRVVHSLFRDPFNRRVMGVAVGTFTYCLMVLRSVRGPLAEDGEPVIPNVAVTLSLLLGVLAILAIVAFIDHNAHTLEISAILRRVTNDTIRHIERAWTEVDDGPDRRDAQDEEPPPGEGHAISFAANGWLQQVDHEALLALVPDGGTVRLDTVVGRFAVSGTPLCTVWPAPDDPDATQEAAQKAAQVGVARTMQQDPSYGIRQLADVALIALSTGVNDPTTAQDAIFHMVAVLHEALVRDLPPRVERDDRGRRLLHAEGQTHDGLVDLAFDELRRQAASLPTVCIYLLEALHLLEQSLRASGLEHRAGRLRAQAGLVMAGCERADVLPADLAHVRREYTERFPGDADPATGGPDGARRR